MNKNWMKDFVMQKPIRKVSVKRAGQQREYAKLRLEWLRNRTCERCGKMATEIHHKRGKIGELLNDARYFSALCSSCHAWAHHNPNEAREAGLLCEKGKWNERD